MKYLYKWNNILKEVENTVAKGEIDCFGQFFFCCNVFKRRLLQRRQKASIWRKGLVYIVSNNLYSICSHFHFEFWIFGKWYKRMIEDKTYDNSNQNLLLVYDDFEDEFLSWLTTVSLNGECLLFYQLHCSSSISVGKSYCVCGEYLQLQHKTDSHLLYIYYLFIVTLNYISKYETFILLEIMFEFK